MYIQKESKDNDFIQIQVLTMHHGELHKLFTTSKDCHHIYFSLNVPRVGGRVSHISHHVRNAMCHNEEQPLRCRAARQKWMR